MAAAATAMPNTTRRGGSKSARPHHLSSRTGAAGQHEGWTESLTALTDAHAATRLLDERQHEAAGALAPQALPTGGADGGQGGEDLEVALRRLEEAVMQRGEVLADLGAPGGYGPTGLVEPAQLEELVGAVAARMDDACGADVSVVRRRKVPSPVGGAPDMHVADVAIRRRPSGGGGGAPPLEVRVAVIGNVDSGKSTLTGVLSRGALDDGRGSARASVFKHSHESDTGRTSSIGQHTLCLDSHGTILNDAGYKVTSMAEYVQKAAKVVTLVDLAGHERYFKTTAYGLTAHLPDYACLIVGANAGVVGMCKEHLGLALALKIPAVFLVTKIDIAPPHVLKNTLHNLATILKKPGVRKRPFLVRTADDVVTAARHMHADSLAPILLTSSVTGQGLDLVRLLFSLLPRRHAWHERADGPAEFIVDETFTVPGVGTVVAGTVKSGSISTNSSLLLGPDPGTGAFAPAVVRSVHYKRLPVGRVVAGQTAALALKKVKRQQVRKGMVLVGAEVAPRASWFFDAEIGVLTHSTTIQPRYQAVIHCEIVRQSARVVAMDTPLLRSGDRSCVRFRFLQRPEYLTPGTRFVFREGRTKGIGVVVGTEMTPAAPAPGSPGSPGSPLGPEAPIAAPR